MFQTARPNRWHEEQLWNVSLLPAAKLPAAAESAPTLAPQGNALRAPAVLSRRAEASRDITAQAA